LYQACRYMEKKFPFFFIGIKTYSGVKLERGCINLLAICNLTDGD
jgi:hypothetical protein